MMSVSKICQDTNSINVGSACYTKITTDRCTHTFADNNFEFDEKWEKAIKTGRKQVENSVGKGEIARYEQFLLFPQCFQKICLQTCKKQGLLGKELAHDECIQKLPKH